MTEREKMIEVIAPYVSAYGEDEAIANTLIAAGIGDISAWKHRAEVAERALDNACYDKARTYCPNDDWDSISKHFKNDYVQGAEREIEEEQLWKT